MSQPLPPAPLPSPPLIATPVIVAEAPPTRKRRFTRLIGRHFWGLARWKKVVLILALTIGIIGVVGSVGGMVRSKPPEVAQAQVTVESLKVTAQHSSLTGEQQTQLNQAQSQVDSLRHWFYDKTAPQLWRIGLGFAIAFVLGYMARQFLKTVATLAAIVLIGAGVAAYLGYLDPNKLRTDFAGGTGWVMDRIDGWKDQLVAVISTSISGTIGFVVGFMRSSK